MSLANLLNRGLSMALRKSCGQKLSCLIGQVHTWQHKNVHLGQNCSLSPDAWIHPRNDAIHLGDRCTIAPGAMLQGNISLGSDCSVQAYSILTGYSNGEIRIGDGVRIASHVTLVAANHRFDDLSRPIYQQGLIPAPITIEDDVWIGTHVCILAGITIGKGCVIGAGSVVTKDIPPYSVAVGVPAKVIYKRDRTTIQNPEKKLTSR